MTNEALEQPKLAGCARDLFPGLRLVVKNRTEVPLRWWRRLAAARLTKESERHVRSLDDRKNSDSLVGRTVLSNRASVVLHVCFKCVGG